MGKIRPEGIAKNGKLFLANKPLYKMKLQEMEGKRFYIDFIEIEEDVAHEQHKYYRGVLLNKAMDSLDFAGWTKNEIHEHFTEKHLKRIASISAKETLGKALLRSFDKILRTWPDENKLNIEYIVSTGALSKKEMKEYIETVERELIEKHNLIL